MTAIERFETRRQRECECGTRDHFLTLQDECRDHVGNEEMKLRAEVQQALQHEPHVVNKTARLDTLKQPVINVFKSLCKMRHDWRTTSLARPWRK